VSGGSYVDVYVSAGNTFSEVDIKLCGAGTSAYWWNGTQWLLASNQTSDGNGCVIVTVNNDPVNPTSPSLSDLHGTPWNLGSKFTPHFSGLSSAEINFGAGPTTLSGTISTGTMIPEGVVTITVNGIIQTPTITATDGSFSASFT